MSLSKLKIDQLNDDCLEAIFRQLPLQTSVRARVVCRKFKAVIEERICSTQHSLMLFNTYNDILRYCDFLSDFNAPLEDSEYRYEESKDLVIRGGLTEKKVRFLITLFPTVKTLVLFYTKCSMTKDVVNLISGWNDCLESLVMVHPHRSIDLTVAFQAIHLLTLPALKRLAITGERRYLIKNAIIIPKIISRLEELSIGFYACQIWPVLKQLGPTIRKLRLNALKIPLNALEKMVREKPYTKSRLTHFSIDCDSIKNKGNTGFDRGVPFDFPHKGVSETTLKFIGTNFLALTYLDITPDSEFNLFDIIPLLANMKQLSDLRLRKPKGREYLTTIRNSQLKETAKTLESVKEFHLYHDVPLKHIPRIARYLPNVEQLVFQGQLMCDCTLDTENCAKCGQRKLVTEEIKKRFSKFDSVKLGLQKSDEQVRRGRFARKIVALEKAKKAQKVPKMNGDDIWSSYWEFDSFSLSPLKEDNGYEQTKIDQQYMFVPNFFHTEGQATPKGFTFSSRPGEDPILDYEGEEDFISMMKRLYPDTPHIDIKF